MKFNSKNFKTFLFLFILEIVITQTSGFIRYYVGDFIVVILLYFFIKSFFDIKPKIVAISVLLFSYVIEILQSIDFVTRIGLQNNKLANIIIGNYFSFGDIVAYTLGIITVLIVEQKLNYETIK